MHPLPHMVFSQGSHELVVQAFEAGLVLHVAGSNVGRQILVPVLGDQMLGVPEPVRLSNSVLAPPDETNGLAKELSALEAAVDLDFPGRLAKQESPVSNRIDL